MAEPILVSIAAALAGQTIKSIYEAVKTKFGTRAKAKAALEAAAGKAPDSPEVAALATELAVVESEDPQFGTELRELWETASVTQNATAGGVTNNLSGNVTGKVVQARDIQGGVSF
jgi:hypothetical protein